MQTMNQSLASLYQRRMISMETAMSRSSDLDELRNMIGQGTVKPGVVRRAV
jgi:twitching motility protein PilT